MSTGVCPRCYVQVPKEEYFCWACEGVWFEKTFGALHILTVEDEMLERIEVGL